MAELLVHHDQNSDPDLRPRVTYLNISLLFRHIMKVRRLWPPARMKRRIRRSF